MAEASILFFLFSLSAQPEVRERFAFPANANAPEQARDVCHRRRRGSQEATRERPAAADARTSEKGGDDAARYASIEVQRIAKKKIETRKNLAHPGPTGRAEQQGDQAHSSRLVEGSGGRGVGEGLNGE